MKPVTPRAPRFHSTAPLRAGTSCVLPDDAAHHAVRVLRVRAGDEITLFDGRGGEFAARVAAIERLRVVVDVLEHRAVEREAPLHVVLLQGVSSGERMDFTVRKAVELGVAQIRPLIAAGTVARPKGERAASRHAHWQKVAIAACEQCGRNRIPKVHELIPLPEYADEGEGTKILLSPRSELPFSEACKTIKDGAVLAAGPESGFSADEEAHFARLGFVPASLGPRVLRTETAALAALAALNALKGDF